MCCLLCRAEPAGAGDGVDPRRSRRAVARRDGHRARPRHGARRAMDRGSRDDRDHRHARGRELPERRARSDAALSGARRRARPLPQHRRRRAGLCRRPARRRVPRRARAERAAPARHEPGRVPCRARRRQLRLAGDVAGAAAGRRHGAASCAAIRRAARSPSPTSSRPCARSRERRSEAAAGLSRRCRPDVRSVGAGAGLSQVRRADWRTAGDRRNGRRRRCATSSPTASVPGVTSTDLQGALARAFATWQAVPTASITYQFAGVTAANPGSDDGSSVLGFQNRPDLDRVLASTSFLVDSSTGALIESDIFFNSAFPWSVAAAGEAGRYDLESIALHEIGHFSGLGHSALGETELAQHGRAPRPLRRGGDVSDRLRGRQHLRPHAQSRRHRRHLGSVSRRRFRHRRQPVGPGHARTVSRSSARTSIAFDPATGAMVASFSLNAQGQFSIGGLSPGRTCAPRRAARRCRHRQFFRRLGQHRGHRLSRDVFRRSRRGAARRRQRRGRGEGRAQVIRIGSAAFLLCAAAVLQVSPAFAQPANRAPFRFEGWSRHRLGRHSVARHARRDGDDRLRRHLAAVQHVERARRCRRHRRPRRGAAVTFLHGGG